ncbi:methylated-DNA--[protein]-cysteine S-methyltransferase [Bordetella bronchiseptica]|uniref:Methylated-DNA--protein-cysteine methyltransferase n=2 Tax=Bordetella bronchiseptica TaxID=518 RepID=A0A0C6PB26_BORBO|nr:methylated-DNA--[protein]-cysteine S-methyltransferase [Bordetella bronchiseptica]SHP59377.1 O-6-methylguanine DNA methyltransferase [Mycobacteroides abscessus subsp. abscessus]AWP77003.1 cysteine methyltransferase [Bordetella bronchiseptica]AZW14576.1 methylated-DNA--[protein]-cysteine S-methyltransferase [Bordetella bronchiseptica]AZW23836.1 methylated-DNA--[protein]-cysteine S-methyltransferase [Bordetella bronchiseptica]KCV38746.1 DNA-binding domain, methylated-DNA-[protein]-cysteine S-
MNPPSEQATDILYCDTDTPLGPMRLAARGQALCGAWFVDQRDCPTAAGWTPDAAHPALRQAAAELEQWFAGRRRAFEVDMQPEGTPFQRQVWQALLELPFGATISYGELARRVGRPKAARAVAGAVGRNPISILIPCHRIIGHDTSLTGFGGGLPRKQALLAHEGHRYLSRAARARRVSTTQMELPFGAA